VSGVSYRSSSSHAEESAVVQFSRSLVFSVDKRNMRVGAGQSLKLSYPIINALLNVSPQCLTVLGEAKKEFLKAYPDLEGKLNA